LQSREEQLEYINQVNTFQYEEDDTEFAEPTTIDEIIETSSEDEDSDLEVPVKKKKTEE
jgi:hypothetical protein